MVMISDDDSDVSAVLQFFSTVEGSPCWVGRTQADAGAVIAWERSLPSMRCQKRSALQPHSLVLYLQ